MKQILQDLTNGNTIIVEAPAPQPKNGYVLINTELSLISIGTERMLVDFGKASYLQKARQQPEKVKQVIEKIKTNGFINTIDAVRSKLAQPLPLGYCNVGVVSAIGQGITGIKPGDRVVSNGPHADMVNIPKNLCAIIPDNVDNESAVFTVIASIGLQGVRLIQPTLGENIVVMGAGLIGLLTIQILKAYGCRVMAVDYDTNKLNLAKQFGAEICNPRKGEDPVEFGMAFSRGRGVDSVIITAATKSNEPITQSARMSRQRGRIVLVGVIGLELNRTDFYDKELSFQVSCSYGPGRYDPNYEEKGQDYPFGLVRWTEQRNFEAILDMMAARLLNVKPLITHRFIFEDAPQAYQIVTDDKSALGIVLQYSSETSKRCIKNVALNSQNMQVPFDAKKPIIGFIGAGNYASRILIPAFKAAGGQLHTIVTSGGINAAIHGEKAGFIQASTDIASMLDDATINTIVIATQHNTHCQFVKQCLMAGKNVFVEKPLAINIEEVDAIESTYAAVQQAGKNLHLMVGFNRRFSPQIQKIKQLLQTVSEPKAFIFTINAGSIPTKHWTQSNEVGGGRIIGEACHFIDLMRFLANSPIVNFHGCCMGKNQVVGHTEDIATITLNFADGSFGTIHYLANGAMSFPKERLEVFSAGRILQLDNFLKLQGYNWPKFKAMNLWRQNKGQNECVSNFLQTIGKGSQPPIPTSEIFEVARITIRVAAILRNNS